MKCKNNPKKSYTGKEPSPKGFGWCASGEIIGKKRIGKDGNRWIIKKMNNGSKKWVKYIDKKDNINLKGYKSYFTHNNRDRPFLVYIKKDVYVYSKPNDHLENSKNNYTKLVKKYTPLKIFIGKSHFNNMTKYSGAYGKNFDGNTLLLQLKDNKYVFIQNKLQEFTTNHDEIINFTSNIGNNDVPYPMAFGKKYVYSFINGISYISNKDFYQDINKKKIDDVYRYFELEPFFISKFKQKPKMSLENFKIILNKPSKDISLQELKIIASMYQVTTSGTKKELIDRLQKLRGIYIKNK